MVLLLLYVYTEYDTAVHRNNTRPIGEKYQNADSNIQQ